MHAELMSRAAALGASRASWRRLETAGKPKSGVRVATIIISTSSGLRFAVSRACFEASSARVKVDSSSPAIRRSRDSGARTDPLVGGVHDVFEILICADLVGQRQAPTCNYGRSAQNISRMRTAAAETDGGY